MCLAIPSKIISINEAEDTARVDTTVREAILLIFLKNKFYLKSKEQQCV